MRLAVRSPESGSVPAVFKACPLFAGADDDVLAVVARLLRPRHFRRHEVIFHEGDPGNSLFIVGSGSVKIALVSPEGEEAIITTLGSGDFLGELSVLDGAERSATAVALEPTEMWVIAGSAYLDVLEAEPQLRRALLAALAGEVRGLTRHVEELHFLGLPGRLAMRLVELARDAHGPGPGAQLSWHYTQAELASMIGGSRQTVSVLLSDFADEGLVHIDRDTIVIPDVEALARVAAR